MADPADQAQEHMEREQAGLLRQRRPIGPLATGWCLFCDEVVDAGIRWCSAECRDGWEREARRGGGDE